MNKIKKFIINWFKVAGLFILVVFCIMTIKHFAHRFLPEEILTWIPAVVIFVCITGLSILWNFRGDKND
jgi:hypothetical protein